eukprot:scaffold173896_cov30-Tisochrysis_lutea.AAC.1
MESDDSSQFLSLLNRLSSAPSTDEEAAARLLFEWSRPLFFSRAPGRLDVIGGIADYSGSLVLQMPIGEACFVAAQRAPQQTDVRILSFGAQQGGRHLEHRRALCELTAPLAQLREAFAKDPGSSWAAYVAGCLAVLYHEDIASPDDGGVSILVASNVPEGKGVSSSAAVEVATMVALLAALGKPPLEPSERLAILCQKVENEVVGAPCGIMDQMASALGKRSALLALECRPATVRGVVPLPRSLRFWGIDSGVRHSVGGSDYGTVRAATFMGRELLRARIAKLDAAQDPRETPGRSLEYLTELSPTELTALGPLPTSLSGARFLEEMPSGHGDAATRVQHDVVYAVADCTAHPVGEHARVLEFEDLLRKLSALEAVGATTQYGGQCGVIDGDERVATLTRLGQLMYDSHASYSRVGLGSDATDKLVELVKSAGTPSGLFGAKITGGGSGGTVCVLGDSGADAQAAIARIVCEYEQATGRVAYVVDGSSAGALEFGHVMVPPTLGQAGC